MNPSTPPASPAQLDMGKIASLWGMPAGEGTSIPWSRVFDDLFVPFFRTSLVWAAGVFLLLVARDGSPLGRPVAVAVLNEQIAPNVCLLLITAGVLFWALRLSFGIFRLERDAVWEKWIDRLTRIAVATFAAAAGLLLAACCHRLIFDGFHFLLTCKNLGGMGALLVFAFEFWLFQQADRLYVPGIRFARFLLSAGCLLNGIGFLSLFSQPIVWTL